MRSALAVLFEFVDFQIPSLNLFPSRLSLALLKSQIDLGVRMVPRMKAKAPEAERPTDGALPGLGSDLAVELAPLED